MEREDMQKHFLENKYNNIKPLYKAELDIINRYCNALDDKTLTIDSIRNESIECINKLRKIRHKRAKELGFDKYIDLRIWEKGYSDFTYKDLKNYQKAVKICLSPYSKYIHTYFKRRYNRKKYDELITEIDFDKEYYSYLISLDEIENVMGKCC